MNLTQTSTVREVSQNDVHEGHRHSVTAPMSELVTESLEPLNFRDTTCPNYQDEASSQKIKKNVNARKRLSASGGEVMKIGLFT